MVLAWLCNPGTRWWRGHSSQQPKTAELVVLECLEGLGSLLILLQSPAEDVLEGPKLLVQLRNALSEVLGAVNHVLDKSCESTGSAKPPTLPTVVFSGSAVDPTSGGHYFTSTTNTVGSTAVSLVGADEYLDRVFDPPGTTIETTSNPVNNPRPASGPQSLPANRHKFPNLPPTSLPAAPVPLFNQRLEQPPPQSVSDRGACSHDVVVKAVGSTSACNTSTSPTVGDEWAGVPEDEWEAENWQCDKVAEDLYSNAKDRRILRLCGGDSMSSCAPPVTTRLPSSQLPTVALEAKKLTAELPQPGSAESSAGPGPLSQRLRRSLPGLPALPEASKDDALEEVVDAADSEQLRKQRVNDVRKSLTSIVESGSKSLPGNPVHGVASSKPASSSRAGTFREMFQVCSSQEISLATPACLPLQAQRRTEADAIARVASIIQAGPLLTSLPKHEGPLVSLTLRGQKHKGEFDSDSDSDAGAERYVVRELSDGRIVWKPYETAGIVHASAVQQFLTKNETAATA